MRELGIALDFAGPLPHLAGDEPLARTRLAAMSLVRRGISGRSFNKCYLNKDDDPYYCSFN
jgi:hypothetical protein